MAHTLYLKEVGNIRVRFGSWYSFGEGGSLSSLKLEKQILQVCGMEDSVLISEVS